MVHHGPQGVFGRLHEVPVDAHRGVPAIALDYGRERPGVRNWGAGRLPPFISPKRSAAYIGHSMPVTQTSPSPWAAWASPQEKSAPGACTGR